MKLRRFLSFALIALAAQCGCGRVEKASLCILHTNDIHGHMLSLRVAGRRERLGGAAILAGCVKAVREENRVADTSTLLLDAGDFYMGTPEGNISKGVAIIEIMNAIGYDAMAVGNHDLDEGVANLMALAELADFPFVAVNAVNAETRTTPPFLRPYVVERFGPLRVGVIGVTIEGMTPQDIPGGGQLVFRDPEAYVRGAVVDLEEEGVDFTVVVSHLGLWGDKMLARKVKGLDVIIGGHHHLSMEEPFRSPDTGTLICQAGSYGRYLGKLRLEVDLPSGKVEAYDYELIPLSEGRWAPDPAVAAIVDKWRTKVGARFDEVIGYSESDFYKDREGVGRLGEMMADAMREVSGAQIAFNQRHGIRAPLLGGDIRYRDVYSMLPFDDTLWTVELTGSQIRKIMERVLSFRRPDNLRFSGLRVEYDPTAYRGRRIVAIKVGDEDLDDNETYRVAVNTYLARWGFINDLVTEGRNLRDTGIFARDIFSDYIRAHSPLSADASRSPRLIAREPAPAYR